MLASRTGQGAGLRGAWTSRGAVELGRFVRYSGYSLEYSGGYRGGGDQMPYRPRLQERRASSRPHFWFWFLMVDN